MRLFVVLAGHDDEHMRFHSVHSDYERARTLCVQLGRRYERVDIEPHLLDSPYAECGERIVVVDNL